MILTPLQKLPKHVAHLGKMIVATGFEWLPKVQKIAKSGHPGDVYSLLPLKLKWRGFNTVDRVMYYHFPGHFT